MCAVKIALKWGSVERKMWLTAKKWRLKNISKKLIIRFKSSGIIKFQALIKFQKLIKFQALIQFQPLNKFQALSNFQALTQFQALIQFQVLIQFQALSYDSSWVCSDIPAFPF